MAVGACGCSGGIFGQNYASLGGVDKVVPVDVLSPAARPIPTPSCTASSLRLAACSPPPLGGFASQGVFCSTYNPLDFKGRPSIAPFNHSAG